MDKQEIHKLAERYLTGDLDAKEKQTVDDLLETDNAFGQVFSRYLIANQEAKELARAKWKEELMTHFKKEEQPTSSVESKKGRLFYLRRLAAVAAVFLLVFGAFWLWNKSHSPNLFADATSEVYQARIDKLDKRSEESQFKFLFDNKDFKQAQLFAKKQFTIADEMDKMLWQERQGFCLWQLKRWEEALVVFKDLEKNDILLAKKNPALWYQAITYLGMEDKEQCKQVLERILASPEHNYMVKAKDLRKQL